MRHKTLLTGWRGETPIGPPTRAWPVWWSASTG